MEIALDQGTTGEGIAGVALQSFSAPTVLTAPGATQAEARLLAEIESFLVTPGADLAGLARPLRIVVPSESLRQHLNTALLRRFGRALLGVFVQTQRALALEVLERAGEALPSGSRLVPVLVRRHARREPALRGALEELQDGYGLVEGSVRDLLDAGLEVAHGEALQELLAEQPAHVACARAAAVVRVACGTLADLDARGLGHRSTLLSRARSLVAARGEAALPTRALWIHGFADVTGCMADWLEVLVQRLRARVVVSLPPDPANPGGFEAGFVAPFIERFSRWGSVEPMAPCPLASGGGAPPRVAVLRAPGTTAEVRAAAVRIRALLDDGARPEGIGIVARSLEPYRAALTAQLRRLAVPFSATGVAGSADAATRRARALARLLKDGARTPLDVWLDCDARPGGADPDLRLGLHVLGAARLDDLAGLDLEEALGGRTSLRLPVRRGSASATEEEDPGAAGAREAAGGRRPGARVVSRGQLARIRERALGVRRTLREWPERESFATHRSRFRELLESGLGWGHHATASERVAEVLVALEEDVAPDEALDRDEFRMLVRRELERAADPPAPGKGAGVQVLGVMAARGRTFEHLFVLGLDRDVFPRPVRDDPILPDALREPLRQLLPDLPRKTRGREEERHLFADLLASAADVRLSWQHVSEEGREGAESPLLRRLSLAVPGLEPSTAPLLYECPPPASEWALAPRPAHEHAVLTGLHLRRDCLAAPRAHALDEVRRCLRSGSQGVDPKRLARAQIAILDELDPDRSTPEGAARFATLGPYFGFVGARPVSGGESPEFFVTRLEAVARCPWQAFLLRELRLQPTPDALDALPTLNPRLRGSLVHGVLEELVRRRLPNAPVDLAKAWAKGPTPIDWPDSAELARLLAEQARRVALEEGLAFPALAPVLAGRVRACLDEAARDWAAGPSAVLGAELFGEVAIEDDAGRARRIGFRADVADLVDGALRLTDYKTGKPPSMDAKPGKRRDDLMKQMHRGQWLQAAAYLEGARQLTGSGGGIGRFLCLADDLEAGAREVSVEAGDADLIEAFRLAARIVLSAVDFGALPPRLFEIDHDREPNACDYCEVSAACLRGESGHRARLGRWLEWATSPDGDRGPDDAGPVERSVLALLTLGRAAPAPRRRAG